MANTRLLGTPARLAILLLLTGNTQAEPLNLQRCLEQALTQYPEQIIHASQVTQAEAALKGAEGARLPQASLALTATRTNNPLSVFGLKLGQELVTAGDFNPDQLNAPADINNLNTRLEVSLPVYTGGRLQSQVDQARAAVQTARAGDESSRQTLIMQVAAAYDAVHMARAYRQVAEQAEAAAVEYARIAQRLLEQGVTVKSDLLSARAHLEEARTQLTEAANNEALALNQLRLYMGLSPDTPLEIAEPVSVSLPEGSEAELRKQALSNQAGLAAMRGQLEAAGAQVRAARAGRLPHVSLMMRQEWNDRNLGMDATSYTLAGVLSWQAFDGGITQSAADQAEAGRIAMAARLKLAEHQLENLVIASRRKALEAEARVQARESAAGQAEEAQRLVKKRYENGLATLVELLSAQAQLNKARADLVAARHEQVVQRLELKRALGVLSIDRL